MINTTAIVIDKLDEIKKHNIPMKTSYKTYTHEMKDRKTTVDHLSVKDTIISDMQDIIDEATKTPLKGGDDPTTLQKFLNIFKAKTPKQIAEHTAAFISHSETSQTGVNADGCIEFKYGKKSYKVPSAFSLPGMLMQIKSGWGDGVTHNPSAGGNPNNYGLHFRKAMQEDIRDKRNWVKANLCDPKERKSRDTWVEWLKKCTDTTDIYYQCRNYILNPKSLEGVHIPAPDQNLDYTEWRRVNSLPCTSPKNKPACSSIQTPSLRAQRSNLPEPTPAPAPIPIPAPTPEGSRREAPRVIPRKTPIPSQVQIVVYSEKAIALFGDTKAMKQQLIELHGAFCRHLKYNNEPTPGWVFSKKRESALRQLINV